VRTAETTLLRRAEVARRLNIKPSTLLTWAQQGRGPKPIRLSPRCIRYRPEDVAAFLRRAAK